MGTTRWCGGRAGHRPVLGGALVAISWHWVFWFNVPFGLAGSLWGAMILHEVTGRSEDRSFDSLGTITFLIGLTASSTASPRAGSRLDSRS